MGAPFLVAAAFLASFSPHITTRQWLMAATLGALYYVASRVDFEVAMGSAVPSQQVLVAMYLLLPATMPPLVALCTLLFIKPSWMRRPFRGYSLLLRAASAWQTMGPALVMYHFHDGPPRLSNWLVYLVALVSQFAIDASMAVIRVRSLQMPLASLVRPLRWTFAIDTVMALVGLSAVIATDGSWAVVVFLLAPVGLIYLLAHDRRRQLETSISLGQAVLEARDEARLDPLTGVANRRAWEEAVEAAQRDVHASWGTRIVAVAIADVDRLKQVNDTLGHPVGDALIAATAAALLRESPPDATVARLGGDEFGVLWVTTRDEYEASDFEGALRAVMIGADTDEQFPVLASIGFATCPTEDTVAAAVERADRELVHQKHRRVTD
jgi:diguanylate cyclase (GGDEF)-like protein